MRSWKKGFLRGVCRVKRAILTEKRRLVREEGKLEDSKARHIASRVSRYAKTKWREGGQRVKENYEGLSQVGRKCSIWERGAGGKKSFRGNQGCPPEIPLWPFLGDSAGETREDDGRPGTGLHKGLGRGEVIRSPKVC